MEGFLDEAGRELQKRRSQARPSPTQRDRGRAGKTGDRPPAGAELPRKLVRSIKDEVVLALLEAGVTSPAEVGRAQQRAGTRSDVPLWRYLLTAPGADRAEILEVAATATGHPWATVVDGDATLNLFDALKQSHSAYWMDSIATRGALPIDSDLDASSGELTVTFVTADPLDPELEGVIAKLGVMPELVSAPASVMDPLLDAAVGRRELPAEEEPVSDTDEPEPAYALEDDEGPAGEPDEPAREDDGQDEHPVAPGVEKDRVVVSLLRKGIVTPAQVSALLESGPGKGVGNGFWRKLATMDGVDRERVYAEAAEINVFPSEEIEEGRPDLDFCRLIMETMTVEQRTRMVELNLLPFDYELNDKTNEPTLVFVSHDPGRAEAHHLLGRLDTTRFELRYAPEQDVAAVIVQLLPEPTSTRTAPPARFSTYEMTPSLERLSDPGRGNPAPARRHGTPLETMFERLLADAVRAGASDIHMYPGEERLIEVHLRVEGRLQPWSCDEDLRADAFMAAVRSQAGMPSEADARGPADGYLQRRIDDAPVRFRVSVLPMTTANGASRAESIVIRIQDSRNLPGDMGQLGLEPATRESLDRALAKSQGMIVLTGPAGSGRTTTMAAALHSVVQPELSTISIEDPVDYVRDGVRHVQIDRTLELEAALRAVLRHDPDVVLVGEIRDRVSADLAVKLANTGQLVFSLLQTADTVSAVGALLRMGVEPFLVAYAVNLIVAQRLVREVCPKCSVSDNRRDPVLMRRLGFTDEEILSESILRSNPGTKCAHCAGRGYRGRRVVSEALYFSTPIRHLVTESGEDIDEGALRDLALEQGMSTLATSCRQLVLDGVTTVEELLRIHA